MSWRLEYPQRPWTLNKERKENRFVRAERVKEWRSAFHLLALEAKIPRLPAIGLDVQARLTGVQQDPVALFPAYKAALDGIVDAGVVPDDTWDYVKNVNFLPPEKGKPHALIVWVYEADPNQDPVPGD